MIQRRTRWVRGFIYLFFNLTQVNILFCFCSDDSHVNAFAASLRGSEYKNKPRGFLLHTGATFIFNKHQYCCWPACSAKLSQWLMMAPTGWVRFTYKLGFFSAESFDLTAVRRKKENTHTKDTHKRERARKSVLKSAGYVGKQCWQMVWRTGSCSQAIWWSIFPALNVSLFSRKIFGFSSIIQDVKKSTPVCL